MDAFKNLSDGESDGIVLFCMRNKKLHPIMITKEQAELLDATLPIVFNNEKMHLSKQPIDYKWIKKFCG